MRQLAPPANASEEAKMVAAAARIKGVNNETAVLGYAPLGCLLPQYAMTTEWLVRRSDWLLRDDGGHMVGGGPLAPATPNCVAWVDFANPAAVDGWVAALAQWVGSADSLDGVALDGCMFDDEFIWFKPGHPGPLVNVSGARRADWLAGLNRSQLLLGHELGARGGVLLANGVGRAGEGGLLFEEWCDEHKYLRERSGCEDDMARLRAFTADGTRLGLAHITDGGGARGSAGGGSGGAGGGSGGAGDGAAATPTPMPPSAVLKLAAFLWAAGPRALFAHVPPLPGERQHWQCDEWVAAPRYAEYERALGLPTGPGASPEPHLYSRSFASGTSLEVDYRPTRTPTRAPGVPAPRACIRWADGATSGECGARPVCDVTAFGAVGDGVTLNTGAFAGALRACAGGGVVRVPAGVFLTSPFNLTSHQRLEVAPGGTVRGTTDLARVPRMAPFPSMAGNMTRDGFACRLAPLVGAFNASNVSIGGGGTIDGQGPWFWRRRVALGEAGMERPRLIEVQYVRGFVLRDVALVDSPFWTVHPFASRDVHVANVTIRSSGVNGSGWGANTDGIDPDSCEDVVIEDVDYCAGDDAIAIKSGWNWAGQAFGRPTRNVTVRRVRSGCRGGFTIGSEMSGGVEGVLFEDCSSTGESGIRISSELGRGGYVRDVRFVNMRFRWRAAGSKAFLLHVNQDYKPDNPNQTLSRFSNLSFVNLSVDAAPDGFPLGDITCLPQSPCETIELRTIRLAPGVGAPQPLHCSNAHGTQADVPAAVAAANCTRGDRTAWTLPKLHASQVT